MKVSRIWVSDSEDAAPDTIAKMIKGKTDE